MAEPQSNETETPNTSSGTQAVMKPSSFQFVTFSELGHMRDPKTLSRIRRHAMKDIGLQRRKPKKKRYWEVELGVPMAVVQIPAGSVPTTIGGGGVHTFFKLPVELDEIGKALLANIFRDDGEARQTAHRNDWFSIGLDSSATFNQILGNSELHREAMRNPHRSPRETELSIHYHQLAVSSLRKAIEDNPNNISDEMIGTASGMIVYAEISGVLGWWLPQRKGMVDMIRAKGLENLARNHHLRLTCSWVELRGAYMQDIKPLLALPYDWLAIHDNFIDTSNSPFAASEPAIRGAWTARFPDLQQWLNTFDSVASLAEQVSFRLSRGYTEESEIIDCTNVISHQLLSFRPLEYASISEEDRLILEACRLAMLLFIASIYRQYGAHPTNTCILVKRERALLERMKFDWKSLWQLHLWVLCISLFESNGEEARTWVIYEICRVAQECPVRNGAELLNVVKPIVWIPQLLDEKSDSLKDVCID